MNAIATPTPVSSAPASLGAPSLSTPRERALPLEVFEQARAAWKLAAKNKQLTSESLAAWAILRGADPKLGFTPITNSAKLANGAQAWGAYEQASNSCARLARAALAPWERMLSEAEGATLKGYQWVGSHPMLAALAAGAKPL